MSTQPLNEQNLVDGVVAVRPMGEESRPASSAAVTRTVSDAHSLALPQRRHQRGRDAFPMQLTHASGPRGENGSTAPDGRQETEER
jgi:hypothetical protein